MGFAGLFSPINTYNLCTFVHVLQITTVILILRGIKRVTRLLLKIYIWDQFF
jgi:uncharacterized membrane protein